MDEKYQDEVDPRALEANSRAPSPASDGSTIGDEHDHHRGDHLAQVPTNGSAMERTLSVVRTRESGKSLGPPPDGGLQAWMQVALGHFIIFNTWGYINSFGVFQTYYTTALNRSPSDISWVGSIQIFLLFFVGTFSGRATDAGYFRFTLTVGATLECFCIFMTSLCTEYWQLFLAQGLGQGIGCGLMFCPTLALISTYFTKRRVGMVGRLVPNFMADRFTGPLNLLIPFSCATAIVAYCWSAVSSMEGLWIFAAFYGFAAAGIQSLFPATLSTLTTDLKKIGVRMGMVLSVVAVAALIGSPIAGALIQRDDGEYLYAQMFMGSAIILGTLTLTAARVVRVGKGLARV